MSVHDLAQLPYDEADLAPVLDENETLREELRELVYASGRRKAIASKLFPNSTVGSAESRLHRVLEPDPTTFLDVDLLPLLLKELGPPATLRFARFFLKHIGLAARGIGPRTRMTLEERLAALEERRAITKARDERERREIEDLRREHEREKRGKR